MNKYDELQAAHQQLLARSEEVEDPQEILEDVLVYIEQIKIDAEYVPDPRERNQLRANLRYWASFVYDHTGSYPNTTLRPASVPETESDKGLRSSFTFNRIVLVVIFAAIAFIATSLIILNSTSGLFPMTAALPGTYSPTPRSTQTVTSTPPLPSPTDPELIPITGKTTIPTLTLTASPTFTPTRMRTATATPIPSQTLTPTLDLDTIEIYKTDVVLLNPKDGFSSATEVVLLPSTGGGGENGQVLHPILLADHKAYMAARLQSLGKPAENCGTRSLTIAFDPIDLFSELEISAPVQLSQGGNIIRFSQLEFSRGSVTFLLPDPTSNAAVMVQVGHPLFLFETVIVQFYADCSRNREFLYYRPDLDQEFSQTDPSELQVSWLMSTWGPSPGNDGWIATVFLIARGGDGNYIYWASGDVINTQENGLLLDDRLFISKQTCEPARIRIGVTSAGQTIQRDMVVKVSECIERDQTPIPTPTYTHTPTHTPSPMPTSTP